MTDRIVRLPVRGRARATLPRSQYEPLRLQDSDNLGDGSARAPFREVFAVFIHLAHTMGQAGAEISETMHRNGDDDPSRCA